MRTLRNWKAVSAVVALAAVFLAAGCRKAKTDVFPESGMVAGWQKTGDTRTYAAKDLWQYIDGEAEKYISAGVVSASTADYKYQDKLEAIVDVYTMSNAAGAAKLFDANPAKDASRVPLGDAGVAHAQSVSFRKGPYVVRIVAYESAPETQLALMALARAIEAKL
jgi:hypothetical protein